MKKKYLWFLLLIPSVVFADGQSPESFMSTQIIMNLIIFFTFLKPLSKTYGIINPGKWLRNAVLIKLMLSVLGYVFVPGLMAFIDLILVIFGWMIAIIMNSHKSVSASNSIRKVVPTITGTATQPGVPNPANRGLIITCAKCKTRINITDKFCTNCGAPIEGNNISIAPDVNVNSFINKKAVLASGFDPIYSKSEDELVESFLKRELEKCGLSSTTKLIPVDALKRKKTLNLIFDILVFVYIAMIFFHFPILTYIIGLVILIICYKSFNKYNFMKFLVKKVKERPSEKITNIIITVKESMVEDRTKNFTTWGILIAIVLPLVVFYKPVIMYEEMDDGYGVRFYTFGLSNFKTAEIPSEYKGEPVISLRGNTFSNMPFLTKVELPDTITEIRGQAFKNDIMLKTVNIPKRLEYLGGGAFYNCKNIKEIELPDTLTYMGGEVFYGAEQLEKIKLSENIPEIRGDSFEGCVSLKEIKIPDKVTRIGGHAFYENKSLEKVEIGKDSQLKEIGSSAFRLCPKLKKIKVPYNTKIDPKAFKESPTIIDKFVDGYDDTIFQGYNTYDYENHYLYDGGEFSKYYYEGSIKHNITFQVIECKTSYSTPENNTYKIRVQKDGVIIGDYVLSNKNKHIEIEKRYLLYLIDTNNNKAILYSK